MHLTDLPLKPTIAVKVSQGGRLRWKIENEGFNTQKNLSENLKHKWRLDREKGPSGERGGSFEKPDLNSHEKRM